jgi:predicted nucleic acid-binding protein
MKLVKDTMVAIHLAKIGCLPSSCDYFAPVLIPPLVHREIMKGKEKGHDDVPIIFNLIEQKKITVKKVTQKELVQKANQFNIQRGEAEAVALYWQEKAVFLATDDDNVRKKRVVLGLHLLGTPAILRHFYQKHIIDGTTLEIAVAELRKIGWFSSVVLDTILEVKND